MTKFFVQLLLSMMVGVSAALGFSPNVKSELHEVLHRADTALHETVNTVVESVSDVAASISSEVSIEASSEASAESNEAAEISVESDLNTKVGNENFLSGFWLNSSSTSETHATAEADASSPGIELKEESQSTLDFDLGE